MPTSSSSVEGHPLCAPQLTRHWSPAWVLLLLSLYSSPLRAQSFRADLTVANRYLWRGINRTTNWVAQIDAAVSAAAGGGGMAAGVFENRELGQSEPGQLTEVGLGQRGLGERNLWLEYRRAVGSQQLFIGATRYTFHGDADLGGRSAAENTTELAFGVNARLTSFSPALAAYWDVDRVKGWYLEGSGAVPLLAWPYPPQINVLLEAALGLNFGEGPSTEHPEEIAYYASNGFTHLSVGLSIDLQHSRRLSSNLGVRVTAGIDEATKLGAEGRSRSAFATYWFGGTLRLGRLQP
jgi:hypothetical protein